MKDVGVLRGIRRRRPPYDPTRRVVERAVLTLYSVIAIVKTSRLGDHSTIGRDAKAHVAAARPDAFLHRRGVEVDPATTDHLQPAPPSQCMAGGRAR